jgi:hypothetical protein
MSPIPFRSITDDPLGTVGFLRFLPRAAGDIWLGAMLLIDAAGEPIEFTYARMQAPSPTLWRPEDLQLACVRSLCASLFDACPVAPLLILCRSDEVDHRLFSEHIQVDTPVVFLTQQPAPDDSEREDAPLIEWTPEPAEGSPAGRLFDVITARGLLIEPFGRAEVGLREVYPELFEQ